MIFLALICFALVSLIVICSASWVILHRSRPYGVVYIPDTSPCFEIEFTFGDGKLEPTLNEKGEAVYGTDFDYSIEWIGGKYVDGTDMPSLFSMRSAVQLPAGLHYYRIVDNITGQVICESHQVEVKKATLKVSQKNVPVNPVFSGATIQYDISWNSPETNSSFSMPTVNYEVTVADFNKNTDLICKNTITVELKDVYSEMFDDTLDKEMFENNYNIEDAEIAEVQYGVLATCYARANSANQYYANLDQALDATKEATAATTIVAMQSFSYEYTYSSISNSTVTDNTVKGTRTVKIDDQSGHYEHVISDGKTIGSKVTLIIPYDTSSSFNGKESTLNRKGSITNPVVPTKKNKVTLSGTLTNNGTITVGGILGRVGQGISGSTSMDYSELHMQQNATIISSGNLNVFGYVTNGGNAFVDAQKGTVTMPFVIYDFHGGSHTTGSFKSGKIAPFSIFDMPNIQATLKCYGGSGGTTLIGYADLHTSGLIGDQHNNADIKIFGASDALITMSNGHALFEYVPKDVPVEDTRIMESTNTEAVLTSEYEKKLTAAETNITLCGDTVSGDLAMDITVVVYTEHVSLKTVKFPVSHKINLNLTGDYEYKFTSQYKFMPGSELNVSEEAHVIVEENAGLMFYGSFTKEDGSGQRIDGYNATDPLRFYYFSDLTVPAKCNIAGTMTVNGYLGGKLTPVGEKAMLDISNAQGLTMSETMGMGTADTSNLGGLLNGSAFGFNPYYTETKNANGNVLTGSNGNYENTNLSKKRYVSYIDGETCGWVEKVVVTLDPAGGVVAPSSLTVFLGTQAMIGDVLGTLPTPTHENGFPFVGWYVDEACTVVFTDNSQITADTTLYAKWEAVDYTVAFDPNGKSAIFNSVTSALTSGFRGYPQSSTLDSDIGIQYYLAGWSFSSTANVNNADEWYDFTEGIPLTEDKVQDGTITLYAVWATKCTITVNDGDSNGYSVYLNGGTGQSKSGTQTIYVKSGDTLRITATNDGTVEGPTNITSGYTVTGNVAITVKKKASSGGCFATGTLVTLADGTQKKIEDLTESDMLLVFDHESGAFVEAPIIFIERDGWAEYNVVNLAFSDGRTVRLIYEHALFDLTLNKYVYITEQNCEEFIGHEFAVADGDGFDSITLTEAFVTTEYTGCYSLVTVYHLNYLIDGMLSIPGGIEGLFNFFEYDEALGYDKEQMEKDIETYGLYTYDDFAAYMPEEVYNMFQAQYFKISVGKGYITFEEILELIDRYLVEHGFV